MFILNEIVLANMFEETFYDEIESIYGGESSISFVSEDFSMNYNFLEGHIVFEEVGLCRIGAIFISEHSVFSKIDASNTFGYHVGLFEHKLKKFIKSNQKRSHRKFLMR